ncbi:DNA primase [Nakamurella leprariae]|uniref:DNA primase n=1 Tax=Nakamurella leprariae TaxID=2803911 RepID=A0A938YJW6_9ACTN|nr:DNA primase [Nakamurella leprariae]MBM9469514.1 DNA primase [Nakamurella leprariae]
MAGRISEADKERVRDANPIDQVIGEYVALRRAGGGNLKGLCPFHDEKTPSFNVRPARGAFYCFGCQEGGDVFAFVAKIEHLDFIDVVRRLADRAGITLTLVEGGTSTREAAGSRSRLLAANRAAAEFYAEQLTSAEAQPARDYLTERGFDLDAARHFGCGYAPGGWDAMLKALARQGFSVDELTRAGLVKPGRRGPIDQFHRRLLWQIRDSTGDVVGFGARRIFDDDPIQAKYLNTAETPIYRKSHLLFGLDLAKKQIDRQRQAVVVEGYTDVMAMHLAGITTAVASCGTAFGDDHIKMLRRYLGDSEADAAGPGDVIYTFDGDAAGRKAALKAFDSDQRFAADTWVCVAPDGLDPCELRQQAGDEALRTLLAGKRRLYDFAISTVLERYDLDSPEGRVAATDAAVPLVARIRRTALRDQYVRRLANQLGTEPERILALVRRAAQAGRDGTAGNQHGSPRPDRPDPARSDAGASSDRPGAGPERPAGAGDPGPPAPDGEQVLEGEAAPAWRRPDPRDRSTEPDREVLKLALQRPELVASGWSLVHDTSFQHPAYLALYRAVQACGGPDAAAETADWIQAVQGRLPEGGPRALVAELAVEPPRHVAEESDASYAGAIVARMGVRWAVQQEQQLRSRLQRAEAGGDTDLRDRIIRDLLEMSKYRRLLEERAKGAAD